MKREPNIALLGILSGVILSTLALVSAVALAEQEANHDFANTFDGIPIEVEVEKYKAAHPEPKPATEPPVESILELLEIPKPQTGRTVSF